MHSDIVALGCAPTEHQPLVDTVARASDDELAAIYRFWLNQPPSPHSAVRTLAISIIEREIRWRSCLDATAALTPAQQQRVMTFARTAPVRIKSFEGFRVVKVEASDNVWIIYAETQLGRSQQHAILLDTDGAIVEGVDVDVASRLGVSLHEVDISALCADDGSDIQALEYFKPELRLDSWRTRSDDSIA
jgi:hypothetical protein